MSAGDAVTAAPRTSHRGRPLAEVELEPGTLAIGDLHLDVEDLDRLRPFLAWLEGIAGAPRLVVLGDLFEYWLGEAHASTPGGRLVLDALASTRRSGTAIDVVPGNRDFLLDAAFERRSGGCRVRADGMIGRLPGGERVLFLHGDELCTEDRAYQRLRAVLRSRPVSALARGLPLPVARFAAKRIRRASRSAVSSKPPETMAQQPGACAERARAARASVVVCGHAHAFRDEEVASGVRWLVVDAFGGARDTLAVTQAGELTVLER